MRLRARSRADDLKRRERPAQEAHRPVDRPSRPPEVVCGSLVEDHDIPRGIADAHHRRDIARAIEAAGSQAMRRRSRRNRSAFSVVSASSHRWSIVTTVPSRARLWPPIE